MNKTIYIISIIIFIILIVSIIYYLYTRKSNEIPKVIYQTYKDKNVPQIVKERWMKLNPEYQYHLYDDQDCYDFLMKYYGKKHADFFKYKIKDGPIKSDFWRVCILYQFGGIYADIDIVPHVPIREFLDTDTTLYTCISEPKISSTNLNPHFIAATPKNILLKHCIDRYMTEKINNPYEYWEYSITEIMPSVIRKYKDIKIFKPGKYKIKNQIIQLSQEVCPKGNLDLNICYIKSNSNDKKIMSNRDGNLYSSVSHSFN